MMRNGWWIGTLLAACVMGGCTDGTPPGDEAAQLRVPAEGRVALREAFGDQPEQWEFFEGTWARQEVDGNGVLAQTATDRLFPLALWRRQRFADVDVTVRFRPISGEVDASGGVVVRARDDRNYYVVRANALEDNFRLYTVIDGRRNQIASTKIEPPSIGRWHTLRVVAVGPRIHAYLDDRLLIDHRDDTFRSGYVGLWTKADAVTEFDDLEVAGTAGE